LHLYPTGNIRVTSSGGSLARFRQGALWLCQMALSMAPTSCPRPVTMTAPPVASIRTAAVRFRACSADSSLGRQGWCGHRGGVFSARRTSARRAAGAWGPNTACNWSRWADHAELVRGNRHRHRHGRVRLAWQAQGLWLLAEPASSPFSGPGTRAGLPNGNVLARLLRASQSVRMEPGD
jgi:hypothetical protein